MKLNVDGLSKQLSQKLLPVYLVQGDEPLLSEEAVVSIHAKARELGFSECVKLDASQGDIDSQALFLLTQNYSLFASLRRIYLILGEKSAEDVQSWLDDFLPNLPNLQDTMLIIKAPKMTQAQMKKKWVQQVEKLGALITVWDIDRANFPRWLVQRGQSRGIKLGQDAVVLLAEHTEGNLLAASQVIDKLALFALDKVIDAMQVKPLLASDARYDIFDLTESVLLGDVNRALKILEELKAEHFEMTIVLWALSKELRTLSELVDARREDFANIYRRNNIWEKRQIQYQQALQRLQRGTILKLLVQAQKIELMIKGLGEGKPWDALKHLAVSMSLR